jgi:UDP-N-acetylmuramoyl-tripeptide--D-alanyl-D-alanine ligase
LNDNKAGARSQAATMMPMTVSEIAEAVGGEMVSGAAQPQPESAVATSTVSDSRQIEPGSVFVAITGDRVDGHDFVARAGSMGAVAALVDHVVGKADDIVQIVVDDTVEALGRLAHHNIVRRRQLGTDFSVIGITGSVGKTTTKDLLYALMSSMGETVAPEGSFNNEIGLPLTALKVGEHTRFLIAEMGANHVGEIAGLTSIVPPDLSVVLKVGVAHLGEFGSVDRIAQAKSEIVQGLVPGGVAVLNADDKRVASMATMAPGDVRWFGLDEAGSDTSMMSARDITVDAFDRPSFILEAFGKKQAPVHLGIGGAHNVINALAAASVASYFGMSIADIASGLGHVERISPHRMAVSLVNLGDGSASFTLIDDSFNANPDSMKAGLNGLARWKKTDASDVRKDGKDKRGGSEPYRIAVLGAMLELGSDELELHRQIGAYAASLELNEIIAVGNKTDDHFDELASAVAQGAREQMNVIDTPNNIVEGADGDIKRTPIVVQWVHGADEAERLVADAARRHEDTVVLLKGSHLSGLSALADRWSCVPSQQHIEVEPEH